MKNFFDRFNSKVTIPALLALGYFIAKSWFHFEIPDWDLFVTLLLALLAGFGIVNDPTNKEGF